VPIELTMACRICLETTGILLSPCRCSGSIQMIHESCLLHWIREKDSLTAPTCELCKEYYHLEYNRPLEHDYFSFPYRNYLFINPSWHIISFCSILIIIQHLFVIQVSQHLYISIQLAYHAIYMGLFRLFIEFTVQQKQAYIEQIGSGHLRGVASVHAMLISLLFVLAQETSMPSLTLLAVFNQCYLSLYPMLHSITLKELNKSRKITVKNRRVL
jgi:hypothetical protein